MSSLRSEGGVISTFLSKRWSQKRLRLASLRSPSSVLLSKRAKRALLLRHEEYSPALGFASRVLNVAKPPALPLIGPVKAGEAGAFSLLLSFFQKERRENDEVVFAHGSIEPCATRAYVRTWRKMEKLWRNFKEDYIEL